MQSFQMTLHPACLEMQMAQFVALEIVLKPVEHKRHKPYITKYKGTSKCVLLAVVADLVFFPSNQSCFRCFCFSPKIAENINF